MLQQGFSPNLDRKEVTTFLASVAQTWSDQPPRKPGYDLSLMPMKLAPPSPPLELAYAVSEKYEVVEGRTGANKGVVVGNFDVVVPVVQRVAMTVASALLVKTTATAAQKQAIEAAFQQYSYPLSGDPDDFIRARMAGDPTITKDLFVVAHTFSLDKGGNAAQRHDEQLNALLAQYDGSAQGSVTEAPGGPPQDIHGEQGYFRKRNLEARHIASKVLDRFPDPNTDQLHQIENPGTGAIDKIAKLEGSAIGCNEDYVLKQWKVVTLLSFPEFMVVWRDVSFDIGCGIWVTLTVPALQTRQSDINLYAYARYPQNLGALAEKAILTCMLEAALAGAVVGVVLGNFAAAIAAFRALLTECLKDKFSQFVSCMIPGLMLATEPSGPWHDV